MLNTDRNTGIAASIATPKPGHFGPVSDHFGLPGPLPKQHLPPPSDPYSSERSPQQPFIGRVHEAGAPTHPFHAGVTVKTQHPFVQRSTPSPPPGLEHGSPKPHESRVGRPLNQQTFTQQFDNFNVNLTGGLLSPAGPSNSAGIRTNAAPCPIAPSPPPHRRLSDQSFAQPTASRLYDQSMPKQHTQPIVSTNPNYVPVNANHLDLPAEPVEYGALGPIGQVGNLQTAGGLYGSGSFASAQSHPPLRQMPREPGMPLEAKMQAYFNAVSNAEPPAEYREAPAAGNNGNALSLAPRPGRALEAYKLASDCRPGARSLQLEADFGLAVGDLLLLGPGTDTEELIQIIGFGSIHFAVPTQHFHAAGTQVTRAQPFHRSRSQQHAASSGPEADEPFEDHSSWSSNERRHQQARHRRKQRHRVRSTAAPLAPATISQTIRQPDRFSCPGMPSYEGLEAFEDSIASEFRLVSAGLDHGEEFIRRAFVAAKKNRHADDSDEFLHAFDSLRSDFPGDAIALEKLSAALSDKLQGDLKRKWALLRQRRRNDGLPTPDGRQLVYYVLC